MTPDTTAAAPSAQSDRPLISIIVINYNYARFLRTSLDSALSQTYPNVEVIAVDDGSTDQSRDIIESYGSRISSVFKRNGGQGSSLNAGFAASRGELAIFLDADDALIPTAAAEVAEAWRPGIAKVQFQLEIVDVNGAPLGGRVPEFEVFLPNGDMRDLIRRCGEYPTSPSSGNAFSRAAIEGLMPLEEPDWTEIGEHPLVMLSPFFGDVVSLRRTLGIYRIHNTNQSNLGGAYLDRLHHRLTGTPYLAETLCKAAKRTGIDLDPRLIGSTTATGEIKDDLIAPRSHYSSDRRRQPIRTAGGGNQGHRARAEFIDPKQDFKRRMADPDGNGAVRGRLSLERARSIAPDYRLCRSEPFVADCAGRGLMK